MSRLPSPDELAAMAFDAGFDCAGVAPSQASERATEFRRWIGDGCHADMAWMAAHVEDRLDPRRRRPETASWLMAGASYYTEAPAAAPWSDRRRGRLARYVWGPDYHRVLGDRFRRLSETIRRAAGLSAAPWWFVDAMPVPEKEFAARAGLGFVGRNSLVISSVAGSWLHLGGLALPWNAAKDAVQPTGEPAGCGLCRRCLNACPTGALVAEYRLDARRCVAWATVECRGAIPEALRSRMGRWLAGCDECQDCCPWNAPGRPQPSAHPWIAFAPPLHSPLLLDVLRQDEAAFLDRYGGTAVARIGWRRWIRNALVAAGHAAFDEELRSAAAGHMDSPDPLVREHAAWLEHWWRCDRGDAGGFL